MEYQAHFGIDCGVSHGLGVKYPDYVKISEKIFADSPSLAMEKAVKRAVYFAKEYLSNPETDLTTVKLMYLRDQNGKELSQQSSNKDSRIPFEKGRAVIKCSSLDHLLLFALEQGN